ncbi:PREDICTED: tetratricopeptide repeat protein 16-like [Amphimedon queenslandica]|uniref:Uncharacterized protein n=1 Tax=Amphimedon queenslandica TaxID=400682 RepID=A0A1X7V973_AMPQE|nr:PREDICTED: tetratricopeptide repeat protein 16-like [Amphimedon queenslandica]|eukprot:XP_011402749.2 PREDICTED: tetratricopeptide repeat protein 16-like [Amphimedon queenslandica]
MVTMSECVESSLAESYCYSDIMKARIECLIHESKSFLSIQKPEQAIKRINRALVLNPRDPYLYQLRAKALFQSKDYILAIQNITKALRLAPSDHLLQEMLAVTHGCYADTLYDQGLYEKALDHYNVVYNVLPHYLIKCISCYIHLKDYQPAMTLLKTKISDDVPNKVDLLLMRAKLHLLFGNATKCYCDVQAALQFDSSSKEAIELRNELEKRTNNAHKQALHFCLMDRRKEALFKIDAAIDSDPHNAKHHILRGALQRKLHSYNEAIDDFLTAMNKIAHNYEDPIYQQASKQLVLTYNEFAVNCFKNGFFNEALTLLNKAIKEDKSEPGLYINRGDCFYKQSQYGFALADYQVAYELSLSVSSGLHYRLAVVHYTLGMMDFAQKVLSLAEDHFTMALFHSPHTARFYTCRARIRNERNKVSEAQDDIILSLLLHPDDTECLPLVSQIFPGCSVQDLVLSNHAQQLKDLLSYSSRESSLPKENTVTMSKSSTYISELLEGITVLAKSFSEPTCKPDAINSHSLLPAQKNLHVHVSGWTKIDKTLSNLLKFTDTSSLQHCMEETDFHALLLYTKKKCTNEVHKILYGSPNFPDLPPKIIMQQET